MNSRLFTGEFTAEQLEIMNLPVGARALVSAPAGTGKTHTLAGRLAQLVESEGLNAGDDVLVLSFSRAAVAELRRRITRLDGDARYVGATTFDAFATRILAAAGLGGSLPGMDHESRIRRAVDLLSEREAPYEIELVRHILIDEIQDLVGSRAELVMTLLERAEAGFTLFGDPAQAIYGHREGASAAELSAWVHHRFARDLVTLHLTHDHRAITPQARMVSDVGMRLRGPAPDQAAVSHELRTIFLGLPTVGLTAAKRMLTRDAEKTNALLTRTNGEALVMSGALFDAGVPHRYQRAGEDKAAPPWIGALTARLSHTHATRAMLGTGLDHAAAAMSVDPDTLYGFLRMLGPGRGGAVDLRRIADRIREQDLPEDLNTVMPSPVVVSTIHRAKGLEFDRVLVTDPRDDEVGDPGEENRILYVALSRARREIFHVSHPDTTGLRRDPASRRWVRRGFGPLRWKLLEIEVAGRDTHSLGSRGRMASQDGCRRDAGLPRGLGQAGRPGHGQASRSASRRRPRGLLRHLSRRSWCGVDVRGVRSPARPHAREPAPSRVASEHRGPARGARRYRGRRRLGRPNSWPGQLRDLATNQGLRAGSAPLQRLGGELTVFDDYYRFRRLLVDALERDLLGPGSPDEVIADPPTTKYIAGVLFPRDADRIDPSQDHGEDADSDAQSDDSESWDPAVSMSYVRYPSSMGMTMAVDTTATRLINVRVRGGRYVPVEQERQESRSIQGADEDGDPDTPEYLGRRARRRPQPAWRRVALEADPVAVDVSKPSSGKSTPVGEGLELFQRVRPADELGRASVTLVLINTRTPASFGWDADSFFQATIRAEDPGRRPVFVHRPGTGLAAAEEDVESDRLLYRHAVSMATGHGTAVDWESDPADPGRATAIFTSILPRFELRLADSNPAIATGALQMRHLMSAPRAEVLDGLRELCGHYEAWITETGQKVLSLEHALQATASRHLDRCREALGRMRAGIALLAADSDAWEAFRLANRAMLMQRARSDWLASADMDHPPDLDGDHRWRPFQIAFILLCLEGIADPHSGDRELTDLLWFPTGGGKTEAYLGLLAFTAMLRRLRSPGAGYGVTAIMRYTLRLLTIQQFERASLLVCCLESIRRTDTRLGRNPIEIGLWVGRGATPNTLAEAKVSIDKLRQGIRLQQLNPIQLHRCPWCARPIGPQNIWIARSPQRLVTACRTPGCEFSSGLPICVVDQDIYSRHPMLIIATSDKFASMPWRDSSISLFNGDLPGVRPPELIIQDELHLISGPLGTLSGLYETAVDLLCSANGSRPKVIASTATIRRAEAQTVSLFDRGVRQFPPAGISADDSFFSIEVSPAEKGTRLYVGVIAPGTSQTTLLVRTYAAILQAAAEIDAPPHVKDPYWTLVGYFNSLRVLGGARMQVQRRRQRPSRPSQRLAQQRQARHRASDRADQPGVIRRHSRPSQPDGHQVSRVRGSRCHPGDQHDLGRSGHQPPGPHGRDGPASVHLRVHPSHQPSRQAIPRPSDHHVQRSEDPGPLSL